MMTRNKRITNVRAIAVTQMALCSAAIDHGLAPVIWPCSLTTSGTRRCRGMANRGAGVADTTGRLLHHRWRHMVRRRRDGRTVAHVARVRHRRVHHRRERRRKRSWRWLYEEAAIGRHHDGYHRARTRKKRHRAIRLLDGPHPHETVRWRRRRSFMWHHNRRSRVGTATVRRAVTERWPRRRTMTPGKWRHVHRRWRWRHRKRTVGHRRAQRGRRRRLRWGRHSAFTDIVAGLVERVPHEVDDCREHTALRRHPIQLVVGKGHEAKPTLSTSFLCNRHDTHTAVRRPVSHNDQQPQHRLHGIDLHASNDAP